MVDVGTVRAAVEAAGAGLRPDGSPAEFGFPWREDGLYLQQDPAEYAEFVTYLANEHRGAKLSIDIGVASGGQTKFLRDFFSVENSIVVDIGLHHEFPQWNRIKKLINTNIVLEIIDDSHSIGVYDALKAYAGKIDFAFIDGDHSFSGLLSDIMLVEELCVPGALFVLHDTAGVKDCRKAFNVMRRRKSFELLRNFDQKYGIAVFRCLKPSTRRPYWRHRLAALGWRMVRRFVR